jgi:hypothetical protein
MAIRTFNEFMESRNNPVIDLTADKIEKMVNETGVDKTNTRIKSKEGWYEWLMKSALPWGKFHDQPIELQASHMAKYVFDTWFSNQMSPQPSEEQDAEIRRQRIKKVVLSTLPHIPNKNLLRVYGAISNIIASNME